MAIARTGVYVDDYLECNSPQLLHFITSKFKFFYNLRIDSHVKRLDEDLTYFAEDLKQEGKIPPDEPAILPPLPIVPPKVEKRKFFYGTPQSKRLDYRDRDWDRERDRDFELMPPPGSHKRDFATPLDVDQPIDPNEPTYCVCHQVSFGDMIACDNENCQGGEWFHYACVGLTPETRFKGKWYCPTYSDIANRYFRFRLNADRYIGYSLYKSALLIWIANSDSDIQCIGCK
ncbi:hypothetical protein GOBAR_AA03028 [Gossypium barbadense]|uniref:Zinc finger PHD-type domain-containing protein n=1 Tax=Gossypium barbadense TaxID=3634 RepID=A0A2P5YPV9_GOSBA|nr:hypothetical protein GOBAR_AA03028 [Gossypium barbadense]